MHSNKAASELELVPRLVWTPVYWVTVSNTQGIRRLHILFLAQVKNFLSSLTLSKLMPSTVKISSNVPLHIFHKNTNGTCASRLKKLPKCTVRTRKLPAAAKLQKLPQTSSQTVHITHHYFLFYLKKSHFVTYCIYTSLSRRKRIILML